MKISLNIVTALSRVKYVEDILRSMESVRATPEIELNWVVVYDTGLNIPGKLQRPTNLGFVRISPVEWRHGKCRYGINQKNFGIDQITSGWYHLLDDDNVVHPDFFATFLEAIKRNPGKKAFAFNQRRWDGHNDFICSPSSMVPFHIDNTMFVVDVSFIGPKRYDVTKAGVEDGYFFSELYKKNPGAWAFVNKFATYYNFLNHHKAEDAILNPVVDIFVVSYRSEAYLDKLISEIKSKTVLKYRLTVIDNTGNPKTLTGLWNELWKRCVSEYIVILNPDISLSFGWDKKLHECLASRSDVVVALPNRYFSTKGGGGKDALEELAKSSAPSTTDLGRHLEGFYAFMARRNLVEKLKGFDERFRFYFADSEFQLRALNTFNLKTVQVNHCLVWHRGAVSTVDADRLGEIDREAEFSHVEQTKKLLSGKGVKQWHEMTDGERASIKSDPTFGRMSKKETPVKLVIDDIYSGDGRRRLTEAYTKSMWADGIHRKTYWCGVPMLQVPEDVLMISELIWVLKPKLVVECGIWRGGSLLFYASMMNLVGSGEVVGVDINISQALDVKNHPLGSRITLVQGDSASPDIAKIIEPKAKTGLALFILDSNHSASHVAKELELYAPLVNSGGYLIAMDGVMKILNDVPGGSPAWDKDNPLTAIDGFLRRHPEFYVDENCNKFGMTHGPKGFLRKR